MAKVLHVRARGETMKTLTVPIAGLRVAPGNARVHKRDDIAILAESLRRFDQRKPLVLDADGRVIAGAGTLEAARSLGWLEIAVAPSDLSGADAIAYALADNLTAELSQWDDEIAAAKMREAGEASAWLPMRMSKGMGKADETKADEEDVLAALRSDEDGKRRSVRAMVVMTVPIGELDALEVELGKLKSSGMQISWGVKSSQAHKR
jgi:ParB-like chromosome segregation protein Spo0J